LGEFDLLLSNDDDIPFGSGATTAKIRVKFSFALILVC